jgi:phage tail-like protein
VVGVTTPFVGTASAEGWRSWDRVNVEVDATGGARLAREPTPTYVDASPIGSLPSPVEAVDVDVTPSGELYALGRDRSSRRPGLYRYVPDAGTLWRVPCFDDPGSDATPETVLEDPRALCVTADTLFVADGSGDLHAVSAHTYQHRWVAAGATVDPVALGTDGRHVLVLDRGTGTDGTVRRVDSSGVVTVVHAGFVGARDLAVGPDGTLYVLRVEEGSATVERFTTDGPTTALDDLPLPTPDCLVAGGDGALLVGGTDPTGGRTFARYRPDAGAFEVVPGVDVGVTALERGPVAGDDPDDRYGVTATGGELRRLESARLTRPHPASNAHEGRLYRRFDTGEWGTVWYRLSVARVLEGPATAVRVRYRATDTDEGPEPLEAVEGIGTVRADRLRSAGVETLTDLAGLSPERAAAVVSTPASPVTPVEAGAWVDAAAEREPAWTDLDPAGAEDALVEGAAGRYLHVRVDLVGEPSASPRIRSLRTLFDRESYLESLPAIYREDQQGAAFLGRFLAAFETVFEDVEVALEGSGRYLDPAGAPTAGLAWLAEWVGLEAEAAWPEAATRDLLAAAPDLHRRRGTPGGLLDLVETYVSHAVVDGSADDDGPTSGPGDGGAGDDGTSPEHHLSLLEYPDLDVVEDPDAREPFERSLGGPGRFLVLLRAALDPDDERAVDRLVAGSTPAHAAGGVVHLRDRFLLGDHTYLGVNAALTDPAFRIEESTLGTDTTLVEREPTGQVTLHGRLDGESRLG